MHWGLESASTNNAKIVNKKPKARKFTEELLLYPDRPDDISQDEIQTMADRLFVKEDEDFNLDKLKLVGDKATPLLVAALNSDRAFEATFSERGHAFDAKSPFERICELLEETYPPAAASPLTRYVSHPDDDFRKPECVNDSETTFY